MSWALQQQVTRDAAARHVLLCLANYAGVDGKGAFPSTATLCRDSGLSERTIRSKLDLLADLSLISLGNQSLAIVTIRRADRRPTVWDLHLDRGASLAPRVEPVNKPDKPVGNSGDKIGHGVQMAQERGAAAAPDPKALSVKLSKRDEKSPEAKARRHAAETRGLKAAREILGGGFR